jgi:hypothetical protein
MGNTGTSTLNTEAALALQSFALANLDKLEDGMAFVHLVTDAVGGDEWAGHQVEIALNDIEYVTSGFPGKGTDAVKLDVIRNTETIRPGGEIARSFKL